MNYKTKALVEALKVYLRNYILVVAPTMLALTLKGIDLETGIIEINWMLLRAVAVAETLGFIMVAIDRYKHVYEKLLNPKELEGKSAGLIRF